MSIVCHPRNRRRREHGVIAVEFALVTLVIVPLVLGVVEFGRALYAYDTMTKAVRSAARYLASNDPLDANVRAQATCIVETGSPVMSGGSCALGPQLPGLNASPVVVTILYPPAHPEVQSIATGAGQIDVVTVAVSNYPLSQFASILYSGISLGTISATVPFVFF